MEYGYYGSEHLKKVISKFITPHAAVFSSAKAKEIFVKYGITPAEFLRPFGEYGEYAGNIEYNPFPDINNSNNGKMSLNYTSFYFLLRAKLSVFYFIKYQFAYYIEII